MNKTINYYKSLEIRKGLSHIYKHPLVYSFELENMVQAVVNTMVLRSFPTLGIDYLFCKPERNSTPHHFVVKCKVDGVGVIKGYQTPMKVTKEVILKYSDEDLQEMSPLEIIIAAYAVNPSLMDGVKSSPLIDDICLALHSEKENMK